MRGLVFIVTAMMMTPVVSASLDKGEILAGSRDWRYKIFTAEHQSIEKGGKQKAIKSIFKIDMQNGKVWRYRQGVDDDGKTYEEFFEVPEQ